MPAGLKTTSSPIQISAIVVETGLNTFTDIEIPLTLNVLDNEVFVVTQVNIDVDAPDLVVGTSATGATLSTTERTTLGGINNSNVIASSERVIVADANMAVGFEREDPLFTAISEDYLGIIATNNMFLQVEGSQNFSAKRAKVRVYGYRASASASVYAALVQSELLSA